MSLTKPINRRTFLLGLSALGAAGLLPAVIRPGRAETGPPRHLFVNLSLDGGPDIRHLFVPPFSAQIGTYGHTFWRYRASAHGVADPNDMGALLARYQDQYTPLNITGTDLAVLNQCGWLKRQIDAGNVALVNNAVLSTNRDHSHSIIIQESAALGASSHDAERSGWGGRLAQQSSTNIVSLSQNVRMFCNGAMAGEPLKHSNERVIDMSDSRKASLQEFDIATADNNTDRWRKYWEDAKIKRALRAYYEAKADTIDTDSPFFPVIQSERNLRLFGQAIDRRLAQYPEPASLKAFYDWEDQAANLNRPAFGQQLRNLYDAAVCQDVLNMGIASLDYGGWDSHKKTRSWIEGKLNDLFGDGKGFDTLYAELEQVAPDVLDNMVILVSGEFGRQLASNGTEGTDHGTGNSIMLIGRPVRGGLYGELFPESELGGGNIEPKHTFVEPNSDIKGLTSMEQVYARICEWLAPGTATDVVPNWQHSMLESGVDLSNLLPS